MMDWTESSQKVKHNKHLSMVAKCHAVPNAVPALLTRSTGECSRFHLHLADVRVSERTTPTRAIALIGDEQSKDIHTLDTALIMAADTISGYIQRLLDGIEFGQTAYALGPRLAKISAVRVALTDKVALNFES